MNKLKILSLAMLLAILITSCGKGGEQTTSVDSTSMPKGNISYPIETDVTLRYWCRLPGSTAQVAPSMNETEFAAWAYEKTGIKVEYIHPAAGQVEEKFNLMLMSADMPDIIGWDWYNVAGGAEKAIADGYITNLNDLIDYMPHLTALLKENPEADKMVKTDKGYYYVFPTLRLDPDLTVFAGPIVRKDWLDDLGLQMPETMDDWYNMLVAFKEKKGADAPLSYSAHGNVIGEFGAFIGAFGVKQNFYVDNQVVKYGPLEPGYQEFIKTFRKWYDEGLIDKNLAAVDNKAIDSKMLNGNTGATFGYNGSQLGKWMAAVDGKDSKFDLTAVSYPVLTRGEIPRFAQKDLIYSIPNSAAISGKSKNKELAARFLDYGYSKEGALLYNFGKEGETYNMVDDVPVYTDLIMKNPEDLSISSALGRYTHASFEGPYPMDVNYIRQYYPLNQQKEAIKIWQQTKAEETLMPRVMLTAEENEEINSIMTDVKAYVDENSMKLIMGVSPLEELEHFVLEIESMNIKRAIEIRQNALDRYNAR